VVEKEGKMMYPAPVLSKQDFVRRFTAGEFGNRLPTWNTVAEYLASDYQGLVHLRNRQAGGCTLYNQTREQVNNRYYAPGEDWYVSAMAPHEEYGTIQGEVQEGVWGLELTWAPARLPMREALAQGATYSIGLQAWELLVHHMNDLSWEWLQTLLDEYRDHVVEFTCFSRCWGNTPGYNTIFWEVRKY
jgi:hypothetical protein